MKFNMNGRVWEIIEETQEEIKTRQNKRKAKEDEDVKSIDLRYFGITYTDEQKIYLDNNLHIETKKNTLIHELTHCYISCFISHQDKQYDEEFIADISANSHYMIHEIVEEYFNQTEVLN